MFNSKEKQSKNFSLRFGNTSHSVNNDSPTRIPLHQTVINYSKNKERQNLSSDYKPKNELNIKEKKNLNGGKSHFSNKKNNEKDTFNDKKLYKTLEENEYMKETGKIMKKNVLIKILKEIIKIFQF